MFSKRDLKCFLEETATDVRFTKFEFHSAENFSITFKCKVEIDQTAEYYGQHVGEWISKFGTFTTTTWIVRVTFSKLKRLVFRKVYVCHRSAFNKKKKQDYETRNQACRAKVDFRVKFINRNTMKNDSFLKEGLNMTISIDFHHSHKVRTPEAFNLLKTTSETDSIIQGYLDMGCGGTAAKNFHEMTLVDQYGEHCSEILSNANINPSLRHFLYLSKKLKKESVSFPSYREVMAAKKAALGLVGTTVSYLVDREEVVVVTPVMKRVIAQYGLERILMDSTTIPQGPTVTFFYVPSKVGALPVACAIHETHDFSKIYLLVRLCLEREIGQDIAPKIILCNNIEEQRQLLVPPTPTMRLASSRYAVCAETWRWLNDEDSKVERKKRKDLMFSIHSMLYADTLDTAEKIYSELCANSNVKGTKLQDHIQTLWANREQWMLDGYGLSSHLVELSIRFVKEFLLRRCRGFNCCVMVDVVANILENHQRRILLSYAKKGLATVVYTKYLPKAKIVLGFGSDVRRISTHEFRLDRKQRPKKYLYFRTDTMLCDCVSGKRGEFCDHLCAIVNTVDCEALKAPALSEEECKLFTDLAGGEINECPIKPELNDGVKRFGVYDDNDMDVDTTDLQNFDDRSVASSPKSDDYFVLQVKTEQLDRSDPLEEESDQEDTAFEVETVENINKIPEALLKKRKYEAALKAVNDEFRRLSKFFRENPNPSNLQTMKRLARELGKIKPAEKVSFNNMQIKLNSKNRPFKD